MSRKRLLVLTAIVLVGLLAGAAFWLSRPQQVASLVLDQAGAALGLEISAAGVAEYRLRGTPVLVLRDLRVRQPGSDAALLRADRVLLSLPWRTLRSRGTDLTLRRIELDRPRLDLPALLAWLDGRPPSDAPVRLPVVSDGLHVREGHVDGDGWTLQGLGIDVPRFHPGQPLMAEVRGSYVDAPTRASFDLDLELGHAQALLDGHETPLQLTGTIEPDIDGKAVPTTLTLSGPLRRSGSAFLLEPMRLGASARYEDGETRIPFALGMHGSLRVAASGVVIAPSAAILHGKGEDSLVPDLVARGQVALQAGARPLALALEGRLAGWPSAWPTLPPPIGQSDSPLPFSLHYAGAFDASSRARLLLIRDQTRFDARFRLPAVLDWLDAFTSDTPLPPLDGRLTTPELEIAGATLHGVEIQFESSDEE